MKDILDRIADSSANESSHELICRLRDCAHEIEALRSALACRPDAQADERYDLLQAAVNCPHEIESNRVVLHYSDKQPGHNALAQLRERLVRAAGSSSKVADEQACCNGSAPAHQCRVECGGTMRAAGTSQAYERRALRDMLDDARLELSHIRAALGVPYEPHQTLYERTMDAARAAAPAPVVQSAGVAEGITEKQIADAIKQWFPDRAYQAPFFARSLFAAAPAPVSEPADMPEGCTPADAEMLRAANHSLAAENDRLRRRLRPFAQLASSPLSWAMVEYCIADDPEKQTLQAPQMQRAFNRAADALREDASPSRECADSNPPFSNCSFRICDLPGQCRAEGECHHPKDKQPRECAACAPMLSDGNIAEEAARIAELEKERDALREDARQFYNLTQGDATVIIRAPSAEKRDAIVTAANRLRAALQSEKETIS